MPASGINCPFSLVLAIVSADALPNAAIHVQDDNGGSFGRENSFAAGIALRLKVAHNAQRECWAY